MNRKEVGCVSQEVGKREKENTGKGILRDFFYFLSILFFISFCPRHYFFACLFFVCGYMLAIFYIFFSISLLFCLE